MCLALSDLGYIPKGVRLDSGDLSYISIACSELFHKMLAQYPDKSFFGQMGIVASNDINEDILHSLNKKGHAITMYGIGTNLVTCQAQPALGGVYKLVEINGEPRIKLSQPASLQSPCVGGNSAVSIAMVVVLPAPNFTRCII